MLLIIIHNDSEYIVLESQFPSLLCIIFVQVKTYLIIYLHMQNLELK